MSDFSFLHVHTHFSGRGGPASPAEWCGRAAMLGYKALAVADRAPLTGLPLFVEAARREGLTPICGVELDVLLPTATTGGGRKAGPVSPPAVPAALFARDREGVANLSRLSALAYEGWPAREEPVAWEALVACAQGLVIVLLGTDEGGSSSPLLGLPARRLAEVGSALREHFGEAAFAGLPHAGDPEGGALVNSVASAAEHMTLPLIAMPTARYLQLEDAPTYAALRFAREQAGWLRESTQKAADSNQSLGSSTQEYLRSPGEAAALFEAWPAAVKNVRRVVEICAWLQNPEQDLRSERSEFDADGARLKQVAEKRLLTIMDVGELPGDVQERLDAELRVVSQAGRALAWLALHSVVEVARANRAPLGAPLGMADGALLSYALGVSSLNPMPYARPWWLGADRQSSPPLPGVEVPHTKRAMLISALAKEHGSARVAHAACALDITPVAAAQAVGVALSLPGDRAKVLVAGAMERDWEAFDLEDEASDTQQPALSDMAASLRGAPLGFKPDPDIIFIAPQPPQIVGRESGNRAAPTDGLPVNLRHGQSGDRWVPWMEEILCSLNYSALSLPPSHALAALDHALTLAGKYPVPGFAPSSANLSDLSALDEAATKLLVGGAVTGIPYVTTKAAKGWGGGLTIEGAAALVAHSSAAHKVESLKPGIAGLEGELLYRDQLDMLLSVVGLDNEEAAMFRFSLPKTGADGAGDLWAGFTEGCVQAGMAEEDAGLMRAAILASANGLVSRYAAHAWGRVALWSAALKATHPVAQLGGALAVAWERGMRGSVAMLKGEAQRLGVILRPPDVSRSQPGPSLEREGTGWAILCGLCALPGWDVARAERFVEARPAQGFATLRDLSVAALDAGVSLSQLQSLAQSGACDRLGGQARDRQALLDALPSMFEWARGSRASRDQVDLFTLPTGEEPPLDEEATFESGPPSPRERYSFRAWEEANLGIGFTQSPEIDAFSRALKGAGALQSRLLTSAQITHDHVGQSVCLVGILSGVRLFPASAGDGSRTDGHSSGRETPLAVAHVEDLEGAMEIVAFPPNYKRHRHLWVEGGVVIVTARVCLHKDDGLYLLCEHLVPFEDGDAEEELSLKVKVGKTGAKPVDSPLRSEEAARDLLAQTEVVAVPKPQPSSPAKPVANGAYNQPAHVNGSNGNGSGNGHAPGGHAQPVATPATGIAQYRLIITLPISDDDRTDIDTMISLNDILTDHPGSDTVTLRIPYSPAPGAVTLAHLPRGARYNSHLEARLHKLLGPEALAVIKVIS